jgi:hypothetical protein
VASFIEDLHPPASRARFEILGESVKQYKRGERFNRLLSGGLDHRTARAQGPAHRFVSFTRVETTDDLRSAVYVASSRETQAGDTLEALRHAAG